MGSKTRARRDGESARVWKGAGYGHGACIADFSVAFGVEVKGVVMEEMGRVRAYAPRGLSRAYAISGGQAAPRRNVIVMLN